MNNYNKQQTQGENSKPSLSPLSAVITLMLATTVSVTNVSAAETEKD